jgi:hypothetical protein
MSEPDAAAGWRTAGVPVDEVAAWVAAGIGSGEAVVWVELGFDVTAAATHKRAGRSPLKAYQQEHPPRLPSAATLRGPGLRTAARGNPRGMQRLLDAARGAQAGMSVVHSYTHRRWYDDEAVAWISQGIEAAEALAWRELGLTPVEAAREQAQGRTAMQTALQWWRAGIPVEEAAEWIGAGLSPEEAIAQRARGVTVERAAILRSLRRQER